MADCPHDRLQLVEGGYERMWDFQEHEDGGFTAVFHGLEDFTDEGNGEYRLECKSCLQEFPLPDDWEWD